MPNNNIFVAQGISTTQYKGLTITACSRANKIVKRMLLGKDRVSYEDLVDRVNGILLKEQESEGGSE